MKHLSSFLLLIMFVFAGKAYSQESKIAEVGDILKIGVSENYNYHTIKFPRPNFIIKKGGIPNYGKLEGILVEITEVRTTSGNTIVKLKRKDGKKFFNSFPSIKAEYQKAVSSGELSST